MIIETNHAQDASEIRDFLLTFSNSLFYSEPRYLSLLQTHLECEISWITAREEGKITGVLPFAVKRAKSGSIYNSLPYYGSNGGVVCKSSEQKCKRALINAFYSSAEESGSLSATLITNPLFEDTEFYKASIDATHIDNRIGQITPLPSSDDEANLMSMFSDPRPRNIRRALKEEITIEKGGVEMLAFLYDTHVANMRGIGGKSKEKSFFDEIYNHMKADDWSVFTAFHNGRPVAALLLFYFNKTVEYFTPVTVHEYRNMQPMALIVFEAMRDAINRGMINWNWGGTWLSQTGVYDFKKKWGARDYPYEYFVKVFNDEVYDYSSTQLASDYYGFYSIPYKYLRNEG